MSTSTVILKQPSNVLKDTLTKPKNDHSCFKFLALCLWGLVAIITSADTEISHNLTGNESQ